MYLLVAVPAELGVVRRPYLDVLPSSQRASGVAGGEAPPCRSESAGGPLPPGVFGVAHYALPGNAYPWERGRLPSANLPGCHLTPRDPRPARIVTPGLPEQVSDHKKGLPQRDRRVPWIVRTTHQGTPTPGSVGAYPQRLCLDTTCDGMPQAELSRGCPCWEMDSLRSWCACLRPMPEPVLIQ